MASEVDLCNLALGHLGEDPTISSIDPPEGSTHAEKCEQFYPIARDAMLEMHTWNFSTRRGNGAELDEPTSGWQYAYARPDDALCVFAALPPSAQDDYATVAATGITTLSDGSLMSQLPGGYYIQTQPFAMESNDDGEVVIVTNQADAIVRFAMRITDTTKFSPLFNVALSWLLASYLAGPILKGEVGAAEAKRCLSMFNYWFAKAAQSDASQRNVKPQHIPAHLAARS